MSTQLEILSSEECLQLLKGGVVGRVGVTVGGIPEILPVNYATLDDDTIVFRTGVGTKLHAATSDVPIAFEVDYCDSDTLSGWSVLVVGISTEVMDPDEILKALAVLPDGWVPHERHHVIRLVPSRISGRRITRGECGTG